MGGSLGPGPVWSLRCALSMHCGQRSGPLDFSPGPRIIRQLAPTCCPDMTSCLASSEGSSPCSSNSPLFINLAFDIPSPYPSLQPAGISCPTVLPAGDSIPGSESLWGDSSVTHSTEVPPTSTYLGWVWLLPIHWQGSSFSHS